MTEAADSARAETLKGLRELIDWLERHDEIKVPFWLTYKHIKLQATIERNEVCERVQVGTCIVPGYTTVVEDSEQPVYEYKCPESLLVALGEANQ